VCGVFSCVVRSILWCGVQDLSAAPPFELKDLRAAIPDHCWEKDASKSFSYLVKDVAIVLGLAAGAMAVNSWFVLMCPGRARLNVAITSRPRAF
jgi:fatty acid desaturase